jgi:type IV pilus assembly protein PilB
MTTQPNGIILVTGPTGSGKTTTLYSTLKSLATEDVNVCSLEDPIEMVEPSFNQVQVQSDIGMGFAEGIRALMRQDPDIIMVGEIRDIETGEIAIKAAQTGHMVLSTLHTNDAPTTLTRLMNMGIAPFNIATSVILITAQRLARRLCSCKRPIEIPKEALLRAGFKEEELDGTWQPYGPVGCNICKNSGYKGRAGIYQVMPISDEMQRIIMTNGTSIDIADQADREGVSDLRRSGLRKVKSGMTSLEEVESCTNE